ncbi:MAG: hypothetical protein ACRC6D_09805, partial [Aeromonas sp.]
GMFKTAVMTMQLMAKVPVSGMQNFHQNGPVAGTVPVTPSADKMRGEFAFFKQKTGCTATPA